ncbi:MAG TPA: hypothetical protein V6D18_20220 [Thermosynechococcaceae cyanobacterium]
MAFPNHAFLSLALTIGSVACSALALRAEAEPAPAFPEPSQPSAASQVLPPSSPLSSAPLSPVTETSKAPSVTPAAAIAPEQTAAKQTIEFTQPVPVPVPGSAETSASSLLTPVIPTVATDSARGVEIAQGITPGRATRSSSSYFGVGGNIGFVGDSTAVGNGSFVILSKIGLTDRLSARPAVLFGDNITILLPVTYDFASVGSVGSYSVAPYVGGGFAIATDSDDTFNLLATAGVDIPLGAQFTGNAAFNVTFLDRVSFGLLLGVGYNF